MNVKNVNSPTPEFGDHYWHFQVYGPDSIDSTVRINSTSQILAEGDTPEDWLAANPIEAQTLIDAGESGSAFAVKQEAKNFIADNPNALLLLQLGPDDLEQTISNAYINDNINQLTLLSQTYAYAIRFLYKSIQEG